MARAGPNGSPTGPLVLLILLGSIVVTSCTSASGVAPATDFSMAGASTASPYRMYGV